MKHNFAKTKILATLGPAIDTKEKLSAIIQAGVDGLRMNFSHSDYNYYENVFKLIHEVRGELKLPIPILQDLGGPKIRCGEVEGEGVELVEGTRFEITTEEIVGTAEIVYCTYEQLPQDAKVGDRVLIDDGLLHLRVTELKEKSIVCEVEVGGLLKRRKGINLPGMKLQAPSVSEKDYHDLEFALKFNVDYVALSFVREAEDINKIRRWLKEKKRDVQIIAKIEKQEAVDNFEQILAVSDGIMVARGDLGVEISPQAVPVIQKGIIRRCNEVGKLVITATQMLDSMINNPMPTRAEASDVANAVLDGTDVVMLSGETAMGRHPAKTVKTMNDILLRAEAHLYLRKKVNHESPATLYDNILDSLGQSLVKIVKQTKASAIVAFTEVGNKVRLFSKFRPDVPIFAVTNNFEAMNKLNLHWGVRSIYVESFDDEDSIVEMVNNYLKEINCVKQDDLVIFITGDPYSEKLIESRFRFEIIQL